MKKTTKWILLSVGALAVLFFAVKATGKSDDGIQVTAEEVKRRTLVETVSASGKLYPEIEIKVGSPINGEVTQLLIQEGDTVKKGQLLARIQGEKGSAAAQRISLPNVPPGFENLLQMAQTPRAVSSQTSATITAPISGTVTSLNAKKGERIGAMQMPGTEIMKIADMSTIEVRVEVNENNIIKISIGDSADVEVEAYNKRRFKGIVTSVTNSSSRKDAQSLLSNDVANYEVHVRLISSSYADLFDTSRRRSMPFRPGMNARADIKTKKQEGVLSIPVGAVVSKPKRSDESLEEAKKRKADEEAITEDAVISDELEEVVYVVKPDGTTERRVVTTGIQDMWHFEILTGLKEGEKVVTGPYNAVSKTLKKGQKVSVVSKEKLFQND